MKCPHCGGRTKVWKTREASDGAVLRERRCTRGTCRAQFVTEERVNDALGKRISTAEAKD